MNSREPQQNKSYFRRLGFRRGCESARCRETSTPLRSWQRRPEHSPLHPSRSSAIAGAAVRQPHLHSAPASTAPQPPLHHSLRRPQARGHRPPPNSKPPARTAPASTAPPTSTAPRPKLGNSPAPPSGSRISTAHQPPLHPNLCRRRSYHCTPTSAGADRASDGAFP